YRLVRGNGRPVIQGGALDVAPEEPLLRELADFVQAVRAGRQPTVTGEDGRRALALASRIAHDMASDVSLERDRTLMTITTSVDQALERIQAGEALDSRTLGELAASSDILASGMLADALRRRLH